MYIGTLAGNDGVGYVNAGTLAGSSYIRQAQEDWSRFGGVTLWEASVAVGQYNQRIEPHRLLT